MIVMQLSNIKKSYVTDLIFNHVTLEIKSGETIGIVGKNGAGKSTLMKIMAGEDSSDEGTISVPKGISVGYLTQQMTLESDRTVYDEMMKPFQHLVKLKNSMDEETKWLGEHEYTHPDYEAHINKFESLQNQFENQNGYHIETEIKSVITGLNFSLNDLERQVNAFSGGQKTRLALGQILLTKPDLLLLDEPTNHLDMETVEWLEGYLNYFQGAVVIISHDRFFLDKTVSKIYELELNRGTLYHSNYSKYVIEKEKRHQLLMKQYESQQKEINKLETFVEKNIARASTSNMAKSRRKKLESMDRIDAPRQDYKNADFSFDIIRESGNDVLKVRDLSIGYEIPLNTGINFYVDKGDRIAVVGPNGIGKSTLVKTIAKKLGKISGDIQYGTHVSIGYYDQKQAEFTSANNVLNELWNEYPHMNESDIRKILGRFLFTQDEVLKSVNDLSGGEKARIQLAKLMLEKNNLLILDEPTNHLDIDSKEVLESALDNFPGSILFVSHDRYFINRIATRVLEMGENTIHVVNGDYEYFLHKKEELEITKAVEETETAPAKNTDYEAQKKKRNERSRIKKQIQTLETTITSYEDDIANIEEELLNPEVFNDFVKSDSLNQTLIEKNKKLEEAMEEWEALENEMN